MNQQVTAVTLLQTNDIMTLAKTFAESGMFADTKQAAQAFVKIQAGQEIGIPPFASMTGIHIIQGKPAIGAGLIASRVKGSGKYDYKVIQQDDKACSIDFYQGKDMIGNSTFTIEDAKKAQTKNIDKFPKNMLFARAISNGVKWFCPDVFSAPIYTPEEMDFTPDVQTMDVAHEEVIEAKDPIMAQLISFDNLEDLAEYYKSLTKEQKTFYKDTATHLKEKLTANTIQE